MLFERIVSEGIAHNSYFIGSGERAAVIDPRRDCDIYLEIAQRNELRSPTSLRPTGTRIILSDHGNSKDGAELRFFMVKKWRFPMEIP
jgi:hypothetical protein